MELKIKEQYLEYSIGGGKVKQVKLKNLNPHEYTKYYNTGFKEFFVSDSKEIVEDLPIIEEYEFLNDIKIEDLDDDIN